MNSPAISSLQRTLLLSLCLAGTLLVLGSCQSEGPDIGVTVGEIEDNPSQYMGQAVVVSGDIDDIYSSSFTIGGEGFGGELLVIVPQDAQITGGRTGDQPYADDDIVQVTGTVRQYVVADIESEFGLTLDPNIEYEEQEPAVVAQSVAVTPRTSPDTTDTTAADTAGMALDLGGEMQDVEGEGKPVTDVGALLGASDLQAYLDRPVDLSSVDVQQVLSDSTFWIGPSESERLFVFLNEHVTPDTPTEGRYDITAGQTISLEGSVRSLPSMEQVRERLNLDEQAASALETKQFYVWAQKASIEEQQGEGSA